jgi:hypothetical protein
VSVSPAFADIWIVEERSEQDLRSRLVGPRLVEARARARIAVAMPTMSRQELYELVWSQPLRRLGLKLRVSDGGLANICDRLDSCV